MIKFPKQLWPHFNKPNFWSCHFFYLFAPPILYLGTYFNHLLKNQFKEFLRGTQESVQNVLYVHIERNLLNQQCFLKVCLQI